MSPKRLPSFLGNENLRLIVFCGKGGTGKTTSAAATAVQLAKLRPENKVLVVSTDPAHSLGDSFGHPLGAHKTPVGGIPNLWAMEMDPPGLLGQFKAKHSHEISKIIKRASVIHQADVKEFLSFSLPEMDQLMTFIEIAKMLKSTWYQPSEYDSVVMDTPPTGHLLKILSYLDGSDRWLDVFSVALSKYLYFRGRVKLGEADFVQQFLEEMRTALAEVQSLLTNTQEAEFVPVMIDEWMSISETQDLLAALKEKQVPVSNIIVNRMRRDGGCPFCSPTGHTDHGHLVELKGKFAPYKLIPVPLFPHEVRGTENLASVAQVLSGKRYRYRPAATSISLLLDATTAAAGRMSALLERELQFIVFSGKGGVGKTSTAAATALYMARRYPGKKVLLYSMDPAHSVADSLDYPVGDTVTPVPRAENLYAAEMDPVRLGEDFTSKYKAILTDAFDFWERKRGVKIDLRFDRNVLASLAKACPPGLGEVLALEMALELVGRGDYHLCVLDTAPTGHALGLLRFPQTVRDWLSKGYRGLAKHNRDMPLPNLQTVGDMIVKSTSAMNKLRQVITDPARSEFVAVTIPEAMAVAETRRLLSTVQELGIPHHHMIINMVVPTTRCAFCSSKREEQSGYIQELMNMDSLEHNVAEVPLFPHEIRGIDALASLGGILYGS